MQTGTVELWTKEEYKYPVEGDFIPNIHWYVHDDVVKRPAILVVPGGAYRVVSCTEGEIVALEFYNKGYNTFVLTYTTNLIDHQPLKFQPLKDLSAAVTYIRNYSDQFHISENQVIVCGFSAGAHLTGSLAVHFNDPEVNAVGEKCRYNRPDAVILSYPVITSGEFAHRDSFVALLGKNASNEELDYMSLEKHVTADTPPCFLWQTATDEAVPVMNSYLMAEACRNAGVQYEHHVFQRGPHGMSLANEKWASGDFEGYYTMDQTVDLFQIMLDHNIPFPEPFHRLEIPKGIALKEIAGDIIKANTQKQIPDASVAMWPVLADLWIKNLKLSV